jgi:hypothetical protein
MIKNIKRKIKPHTGPGRIGKKKWEMSSPTPCHKSIWTNPGIIVVDLLFFWKLDQMFFK